METETTMQIGQQQKNTKERYQRKINAKKKQKRTVTNQPKAVHACVPLFVILVRHTPWFFSTKMVDVASFWGGTTKKIQTHCLVPKNHHKKSKPMALHIVKK